MELLRLREELRLAHAEIDRLKARGYFIPPEKRRQIIALLRRGGLTDRAIAREVGVSPTTVGAVRRSLR